LRRYINKNQRGFSTGAPYPERCSSLFITQNIKPGFSLKKLSADFIMFFIAWRLIAKNKFDLIHAGEESVFMAMFFKLIYKIPYVYDLDSSIVQQMEEKIPSLQIVARLLIGLKGSLYAIAWLISRCAMHWRSYAGRTVAAKLSPSMIFLS
jgi:hypothetical protein